MHVAQFATVQILQSVAAVPKTQFPLVAASGLVAHVVHKVAEVSQTEQFVGQATHAPTNVVVPLSPNPGLHCPVAQAPSLAAPAHPLLLQFAEHNLQTPVVNPLVVAHVAQVAGVPTVVHVKQLLAGVHALQALF